MKNICIGLLMCILLSGCSLKQEEFKSIKESFPAIPVQTITIPSDTYITGVLNTKIEDYITILKIKLERHSIFDLDLSYLSQYPWLKKLIIYAMYKNGQSASWDRAVTLRWLDKLTQLDTLIMYEFPLTTLDLNKLPPHITTLGLYDLWVETLITGDIDIIPNSRVEIVGPWFSLNVYTGTFNYY